jgi:thiol-disulfide isomerase/thioredoxin
MVNDSRFFIKSEHKDVTLINNYNCINMKYTFLVVLLLMATLIYSQNYTLNVVLEGKQYDNVYLQGQSVNLESVKVCNGTPNKQKNSWTFSIPDSSFNTLISYSIRFENKNKKENTFCYIQFQSITDNNDTVKYGILPFDSKVRHLTAKYVKTDIQDNQLIRYKGEVILGSVQSDVFLIPFQKNTELAIQSKYRWFSWFHDQNREVQLSYSENLNNYINIAKEYPDSRFLISGMIGQLPKYKSKEDLQHVFNNFSPQNKQSFIGKKIADFIQNYPSRTVFTNMTLTSGDTNQPMAIIEDTTKYNLVIFSASWCGYCHTLIPNLKELYNKHNKNLIMTYVSIDDEKTEKDWKELIQKENIPWRSLFSKDKYNKVKEVYFAYSIPKMLLVYPGGKRMEEIDIRNEETKKKLDLLFQN